MRRNDFGTHPPHPEVAFLLAGQWLYLDEPGKAEAVLPSDGSSYSLSLLGWARFIQGRHEEAIRHFEDAFKTENREAREYNIRSLSLPPSVAGELAHE